MTDTEGRHKRQKTETKGEDERQGGKMKVF